MTVLIFKDFLAKSLMGDNFYMRYSQGVHTEYEFESKLFLVEPNFITLLVSSWCRLENKVIYFVPHI